MPVALPPEIPAQLVPAIAVAVGPAAVWAVCTIAVVAAATWRNERAERPAPHRGRHRAPSWYDRARRLLALTDWRASRA